MPFSDTPFERVAIDLIGPIIPASDRGNRFVLTMVDYATRYPEAVVLKDEKAEKVAEALVRIFSRVGVPREVLSDQGPQIMAVMMKEVSRLLSVKQMITTQYHPMCNGLVECFNGTLKSILKKMCMVKGLRIEIGMWRLYCLHIQKFRKRAWGSVLLNCCTGDQFAAP